MPAMLTLEDEIRNANIEKLIALAEQFGITQLL